MRTRSTLALCAVALVVIAGGLAPLQAAQTPAGTNITNTATVDYTVGGVNQPDVSGSVTFKADRRINLSVAEVGNAYTDVVPGQTLRVLTFTVTNTTNATQDFRLSASNDATGATEAFGGTDDFNPSPVQVFVDADANGSFDSGTDIATFVDELASDTGVTVFIVSTIPFGEADGNTAGLTLTAIAAEAGTAGTLGADSTATAGPEDPLAVDTVFGDAAGDTDGSRDGRHSDDDAYRVRTATIAVTKTSTVISDPFNGTSDPKRIPGAVVEYCILIENTGSTAANTVVVSDTLTGQPVTFSTGTIFAGGAADCTGGTAEDDDAVGADENNPNGGSFVGGVVTVSVPTITGGGSTSARFRVTID